MHMIWLGSFQKLLIAFLAKKRVLVNYANDLIIKGPAILLFQRVSFIGLF